MSFKKVMHEIEQKGLDKKTAYTSKQLSEQGYMVAARTSSDAIMHVEDNMNTSFNEEITREEINLVTVSYVSDPVDPTTVIRKEPKEEKKPKKEEKQSKKSKAVKSPKKLKDNKPQSLKELKSEIKEIADKVDKT